MKLTLAGVSHYRAPIELRERVALDLDACRALAAQVGGEAVVLSTCNRTELYVARDEHAEEEAVATLAKLAGDRAGDLTTALYRLRDDAAAFHLFRVAGGLDSLVPGEGEILGLAGLVGSGRTELVRAVYGLDPAQAGEVKVAGRRLPPGRPDLAPV